MVFTSKHLESMSSTQCKAIRFPKTVPYEKLCEHDKNILEALKRPELLFCPAEVVKDLTPEGLHHIPFQALFDVAALSQALVADKGGFFRYSGYAEALRRNTPLWVNVCRRMKVKEYRYFQWLICARFYDYMRRQHPDIKFIIMSQIRAIFMDIMSEFPVDLDYGHNSCDALWQSYMMVRISADIHTNAFAYLGRHSYKKFVAIRDIETFTAYLNSYHGNHTACRTVLNTTLIKVPEEVKTYAEIILLT